MGAWGYLPVDLALAWHGTLNTKTHSDPYAISSTPWNLELPLGTDRGPLNRRKRDVPTSLTKDVGVVWPPGPGTERRESRPETQTRVTTVLHRPYMEGTDWVKVIIPPHSPDVLFPYLLPRPLTRPDWTGPLTLVYHLLALFSLFMLVHLGSVYGLHISRIASTIAFGQHIRRVLRHSHLIRHHLI